MPDIVRFDPFAELQALQKQFFGEDWFDALPARSQLVATDVYTENDKQLVVEAHLPQFNEKDVNVDIENGVLQIQAQKHEKEEDKNRKYVVRESSSSFYRRIRLPKQADTDNVKAHMDKGVLKVTVPFKELPAPKKIAINGGAKASAPSKPSKKK